MCRQNSQTFTGSVLPAKNEKFSFFSPFSFYNQQQISSGSGLQKKTGQYLRINPLMFHKCTGCLSLHPLVFSAPASAKNATPTAES